MMKKISILLLIGLILGVSGIVYAVDWSQYESGRDNIRLDGYQSQPGYIAFTDGNGTTIGYIWMSTTSPYAGRLVYCTKAAIDLTTTKLTDYYGVVLDNLD
jgi:hypothetical protein